MAANKPATSVHLHQPLATAARGVPLWRRALRWSADLARSLPGRALAAPLAYWSLGIAGVCIALIVPRTMGLMQFDIWAGIAHGVRYVLIVGMALGVADAARGEERRLLGVFGFLLNILALVAWAVSSVLLRAVAAPEI